MGLFFNASEGALSGLPFVGPGGGTRVSGRPGGSLPDPGPGESREAGKHRQPTKNSSALMKLYPEALAAAKKGDPTMMEQLKVAWSEQSGPHDKTVPPWVGRPGGHASIETSRIRSNADRVVNRHTSHLGPELADQAFDLRKRADQRAAGLAEIENQKRQQLAADQAGLQEHVETSQAIKANNPNAIVGVEDAPVGTRLSDLMKSRNNRFDRGRVQRSTFRDLT